MKPLQSDPTLYRLVKDEILHGLSGTYIDEILRGGDQHFRNVANATFQKLKMVDS